MSEHSQKTPFIKASSQDQYGKIPLKSWVGKVVAYESQKEQIDEGWGWRYKVRILGDDSNSQNVADEELSYAICLLPTTAGSGAAYKLRSVRVSQGDMVYGIYGGDGPRIIIGVFPRTAQTESTSGNFGTLSGFTGSLNDTGILDGEFNGQKGPKFLKGASGLEPGEWTKATADNPSEKIKEIVPQVKEGEIITEDDTKKNDIKEKVGKVNEKWKPGDNLNTATMDYLKESFEKGELSAEDWEAALKQASEQGLDGYEEYVIEDEIKEVKKEEVKKEKEKEKKTYIVRGTNLRFDNRDKAVRWILNHIETKKKPEYEKSVNSPSGVDIDTQRRYENWLFIRFAPYVELVKADQQSITSDELRRIDKIYTDFDKINPYATP